MYQARKKLRGLGVMNAVFILAVLFVPGFFLFLLFFFGARRYREER
jgi:hypothetical protein